MMPPLPPITQYGTTPAITPVEEMPISYMQVQGQQHDEELQQHQHLQQQQQYFQQTHFAMPEMTELPDLATFAFDEMEELNNSQTATVVPCENYPVLGAFATELASECEELLDWPQEEMASSASVTASDHALPMVENFPVTVEEQTAYLNEDSLPNLRQSDLGILSSSEDEECESPLQSLETNSAPRSVHATYWHDVDYDYGHQSVTVEESTAFGIEDELQISQAVLTSLFL